MAEPPHTAARSTHAIVDRHTAEHYRWGEVCDGWRLLDDPALSVIEECVPPGAAEVAHRHARARQFFYVLSGRATLEFDDAVVEFAAGQGVEVAPGVAHRFVNRSTAEVRFLVISAPNARGDRALVADEHGAR
jgi:mannose-6-phosphate isomerase-like protein (cupin superfamily)